MLVCVAFGQTLGHDFVQYDDQSYVLDNPQVRRGLSMEGIVWAFTRSHVANWHPLTWLSHMADVQLHGLNPRGHHATNLLLHAVNTVLLFAALRWLTTPWQQTETQATYAGKAKSPQEKKPKRGALSDGLAATDVETLWSRGAAALVAALFAVHPLHVESVAWIAERKDLLSTFFGLLALVAYRWYVAAPSIARYACIVACLAGSLMSKAMLVTLPAVLLLLDYWPLRRLVPGPAFFTEARRLLVEKLPLLALVVVSSVVTLLSQRTEGAMQELARFPLIDRIANAVVAYAAYLVKAAWPVDLTCFYPHPGRDLLSQPAFVGQLAAASVLLLAISAFVWFHRRSRPYLIVGWLWYLGTLVPVIGLVQVGEQAYADRYTYVPLIGIFVLVVWGARDLCRGLRLSPALPIAAAACVVATCTVLTWQQVQVWQNSLTLFAHNAKVRPDSYVAHWGLARALIEKGRIEDALHHAQRSLQLRPNHPFSHRAFGGVEAARGNWAAAQSHFERALAIRPDDAESLTARGVSFAQQGQTERAIEDFQRALEVNPSLEAARLEWVRTLITAGRLDEARQSLGPALQQHPDEAEWHALQGMLLVRQGDHAAAVDSYRRATKLAPNTVEYALRLASALTSAGRIDEAADLYAELQMRHPESLAAALGRASILSRQNRLAEAAAAYEQALSLRPDRAATHVALAQVYLAMNRLEEALERCDRAAQLATQDAEPRYLRALIRERQGDPRAAIDEYRAALELNADHLHAANNLAWLLATHRQDALRNGEEAVALAQRACDGAESPSPHLLDTLAAALAETGQFDQAIETAEKALALAHDAGDNQLAAEVGERLEAYRRGEAIRLE